MLRRRAFHVTGFAAAAGGLSTLPPTVASGQSQAASAEESFGLLRPEDDPEFGARIRQAPAQGGSVVGTGAARHDEVRTAFKLLLDAPRRAEVLATARYFEQITARNADREAYNMEWRSRANPLIVGLFSATGTAPSTGDQTHWCAAFVSFCLFLAERPNKFTALSGGYRTFGSVEGTPAPGDIAVFAKAGPDGAKGFGHVGFFLRSEKKDGQDGIVLLGGNQRGTTGSTGAVTEAWYPASDGGLELHSIRRVPGG